MGKGQLPEQKSETVLGPRGIYTQEANHNMAGSLQMRIWGLPKDSLSLVTYDRQANTEKQRSDSLVTVLGPQRFPTVSLPTKLTLKAKELNLAF